MAYNELVKRFDRIREYMREFYVFGFKSRDEYTGKSARSYDDERRRLESWLGDYMGFRQTAEGKNVFISIDSRRAGHNPLYKAWKTKSFTDGDITLHFILFDILYEPSVSLSLGEIMERIDDYLTGFDEPKVFDESTVRKKLKEYAGQGLVRMERNGKCMFYRREPDVLLPNRDVLDFFSEVLPCGVVGSYLLDKGTLMADKESCLLDKGTIIADKESYLLKNGSCVRDDGSHVLRDGSYVCDDRSHIRSDSSYVGEGLFSYKHHYITSAMDSEILYLLFTAIREQRTITIKSVLRRRERFVEHDLVPLKIMVSAQNGRQYLMAYAPRFGRISSYRIDNIISVKTGDVAADFDILQEKFEGMRPHLWGVSTQSESRARMEHVDFTVRYGDGERYIRNRLEREKRCGTVEHLDPHTSRFSADVYDASELVPWIRTFICRITEIHFSDLELEKQFKEDLQEMYTIYGIGTKTGEVCNIWHESRRGEA